VVALVAAVVFLVIAENVGADELSTFDQRVLVALQSLRTAALTTALRGLTFFGGIAGAGILTAILAGALLALRRHRDALFAVAVVAGGSALQYLAKLAFSRPRPSVVEALVDVSTASYPSGHATTSACFALALAIVCWDTGWRWPALVAGVGFALGVSFSRLYLGVHHPSDVVAGWLLAIVWTALVRLAFDVAGRPVRAPAGERA
jgi:undecaprenyl-diphosphatase